MKSYGKKKYWGKCDQANSVGPDQVPSSQYFLTRLNEVQEELLYYPRCRRWWSALVLASALASARALAKC